MVVIGHMLLLRACDGVVMLQQGDRHLERPGAQLFVSCDRLRRIFACSKSRSTSAERLHLPAALQAYAIFTCVSDLEKMTGLAGRI